MDSPARRFTLARQRDSQNSPYPSENGPSILGDDDDPDIVNAPWLATKSPFPEDVPPSLEDDMFDPGPVGTAVLRPDEYI